MSSATASDPHLREIRGQPDAIRRAADALIDQSASVERTAAGASRRRRIVLTGMGSSHDACFPAVDHLASRGVVALHLNTAELLHFRSRWITTDTILVLVSQSGESAEMVRLTDGLEGGSGRPFVVSVTNGLANTLAARADIAFDTRTGAEVGPSSMTFAATLVPLGALARVLAGDEPDRAVSAQVDAAAEAANAVDEILRIEEEVATTVGDVVRDRRLVALVGRGSARATAEMGALTLKECGIVAEGFEAAAFRHGPMELAGPRLGAIVVATEDRTRALELGLASELRRTGSATVVLADDPAATDEGNALVLPPVERLMSPSVSMLPIQLGAHRLALEAGRDPGSYVFASKITTRE